MKRTRLAVGAGLWAACLVWAAPVPPKPEAGKLTAKELAKTEKAAKDHLEALKGAGASLKQIPDGPLESALPGHAFYLVMFRQYPVAVAPPAGLKASNVFAVSRDGTVTVLRDNKELETFFRTKLAAATKDDQLKDAARAWVTLAQQFHQDGFYKFALAEGSTKVTKSKMGKLASAKTNVMGGGNGAIDARLIFSEAGKLTSVSQDSKVNPGPRPICQAMKLLDKDPAVRAMAEDALLLMGRAAKPYLDEQRAKASPELRHAIDRLWERMRDQGP